MTTLPRITKADPLGDFRVRLTFSDGLVRDLDLGPVIAQGGVFEPLQDPAFFALVTVESSGTIGWPNGIDLDPDVLHGDYPPASGAEYVVLQEHRLREVG